MVAIAGRVFEHLPEGGLGRAIPTTRITFTDLLTKRSTSIQAGAYGEYQADLLPSQYIIQADHPDFMPFNSEPGLFVLRYDHADKNILLRRRVVSRSPEHSTFRGRVLQHLENGQMGYAIADVAITFINALTSKRSVVRTDDQGNYQIELSLGQYIVTALHPGFQMFSSEPGFFMLHPQPTTANLFLEPL